MKPELTLLGCADLLIQLQELHEQSHRLHAESCSLLAESQRQQEMSPWPHEVALVEPVDSGAPLPDPPAPHDADDQLAPHQHRSMPTSAHTDATQPRGDERVLTGQQILDLMMQVLDRLPLEQQIQIVKTLCGRTIAAARLRLAIKHAHSA